MWNVLRNRQFMNLKFRRQHLISGYIIDFYCHELLSAIEIDGKVHEITNQIEEDILRQKIIEKNNIKFFRVKSEDVEHSIEEVLRRLRIFISSIKA